MLSELPRPVIFGHRGASAYAPENTLASFNLALVQSADAIELDAKLSSDGEVVVIHDPTVDRTTDGHGHVSDLTLSDLRALDAGSFFSDRYRGEKIPLLAEVFETVGKKIFINVELTNYATPRDQLVEKVCALVRKYGLERWLIFSSFFDSNLKKAEQLAPEVPRGLLARDGWLGVWPRSFGFAFGNYAALHLHRTNANPAQVRRVHRLRRRIHVWTVNQAEEMSRLHSWGVDGIFTDDPPLALNSMGRRG
jgi:glycerophosphoryl diester phosphodiesterase